MGRRKLGEEKIRTIQKSRGYYIISLPIEDVRELRWRERQRVTVTKSGKKLIIEDYKD